MSEDPVADERPQTKPFAAFLQGQRRGGLHGEVSDAFAELVAACMEQEKAGSLTLKIEVKPNKDGETVQITDALAVKLPPVPKQPSMFFADSNGNVSRHNPRQPELPIREVPKGDAAEPRRAAS